MPDGGRPARALLNVYGGLTAGAGIGQGLRPGRRPASPCRAADLPSYTNQAMVSQA